jgi:methyltransferase (TIGR00027 family)
MAVMHPQLQEAHGTQDAAPASASAMRVAALRAIHQLLDVPPVLIDPLALKILGEGEASRLRDDPGPYSTPLLKGLRASVVVRSRLAEDEWARSKRHGVRQYVILGAGLDTFAYRQGNRGEGKIFEVDLPATQAWKRERLLAAGIAAPASLAYVPIDFERQDLLEALTRAGFDQEAPAFFSWLGVTMYLAEEAIFRTLACIANLPPKSGVVFDYAVALAQLSPRERQAREALAARTARTGEAWKTDFAPGVLAERLRGLGFDQVEDYGPERLNAMYLAGRGDGLSKSGVSRLICAGVGTGI